MQIVVNPSIAQGRYTHFYAGWQDFQASIALILSTEVHFERVRRYAQVEGRRQEEESKGHPVKKCRCFFAADGLHTS